MAAVGFTRAVEAHLSRYDNLGERDAVRSEPQAEPHLHAYTLCRHAVEVYYKVTRDT